MRSIYLRPTRARSLLRRFSQRLGRLFQVGEAREEHFGFLNLEVFLGLGRGLDRALFLAEAAFENIPTRDLSADLDRHMRVTPQGLNGFAARFFLPENQVLLNLRNR